MSILNKATGRSMGPSLAIRARRGWIGIDFGTHSIKLAQLVRRGPEFHIAARWTLSHPSLSPVSGADSYSDAMQDQIAKLKALRRLFLGRACAAVLPMALVEHRSFEIPKGTESEQNRMMGEELAAELAVEPQELAFDCWDCSPSEIPNSDVARMSVNAVPKKLAETLANQLLSTGLECQVLDGIPCAMARAVELASPKPSDGSVVAIDLSYTLPLVVLAKAGRPLFARTLRGVGMRSIEQPLQTSLELSFDECQQLLVRYGLTAIGQPPTLATGKTMQIIAHPLQDLLAEIKRTVDYICDNFRAHKPRHVCLFGGGALIKNLPGHISHKLQMPATPWTLGGTHSDPSDAIYGLAAGLSALAWESAVCS